MAVSKSYAAVMSEWKVVVAGCTKHSDDLDFAKKDSAKLADLIVQAEALDVKQEQMKADLAKLTNQYMKMIADGNKLSSTLIRYAKGKYGPSSLEIKDFQATGTGLVRARKKTAAAK